MTTAEILIANGWTAVQGEMDTWIKDRKLFKLDPKDAMMRVHRKLAAVGERVVVPEPKLEMPAPKPAPKPTPKPEVPAPKPAPKPTPKPAPIPEPQLEPEPAEPEPVYEQIIVLEPEPEVVVPKDPKKGAAKGKPTKKTT